MGCREEILECAREFGKTGFTPQEMIDLMRRKQTRYKDSTIRTHVTARLCGDAPVNHATAYDDLKRMERGRYRLRRSVPGGG